MLNLDKQNALRERYRETHPGWRPATELFAELVRKALKPEGRLLDIGCGRGGLVEQLEHPLSQIIGLDPDLLSLLEHRLASAQPPLPRAAALNEQLPFKDQQFDVVIASWLLEHLADPLVSFLQIGRMLRKGGVFIFITPNRRNPLVNLNRTVGRLARLQGAVVGGLYGREQSDTFPAYYRANTAADLERLAEMTGMHLDQLSFSPDPTYLAIRPNLWRMATLLESKLSENRRIHLVGLMKRG